MTYNDTYSARTHLRSVAKREMTPKSRWTAALLYTSTLLSIWVSTTLLYVPVCPSLCPRVCLSACCCHRRHRQVPYVTLTSLLTVCAITMSRTHTRRPGL